VYIYLIVLLVVTKAKGIIEVTEGEKTNVKRVSHIYGASSATCNPRLFMVHADHFHEGCWREGTTKSTPIVQKSTAGIERYHKRLQLFLVFN
jgi:hypothetical protein